MDKKLKTLKEIKEALAYEGKASDLKGDERLLNFCFKNCVIVKLRPEDFRNEAQRGRYTDFLVALTKEYIKCKPEIASWDAFRQQSDTKKTHGFLHEFGVAGEIFPFAETEIQETPKSRPKTSLTLQEFYEMCQIQFHYSGTYSAFNRMIGRQYGSFAEYCILKGYDINSTRWESDETALRVAAKLGSLDAVQARSKSLYKYLHDRNLVDLAFAKDNVPSNSPKKRITSVRLLTKSRFKVGHSCPTKLYYLDNPDYGNNRVNDSFLRALAEGGFQVGELAKLYHPGGVEISEISNDAAVTKTSEQISAKTATLFEAAIKFNDFLVRVDVLKKSGDKLEVIEVKAKSFDSTSADVSFFSKRGKSRSIRAEWESYLIDLAFQTFVVRKAFPNFKVSSFLMLADKSKVATVDGLNQQFLISRGSNGRSHIVLKEGTNSKTVGEPILCKINVDEAVDFLISDQKYSGKNFEEYASGLAKLVTTGSKDQAKVSSDCKNCEYRIERSKYPLDIKSGFLECLSNVTGLDAAKIEKPMVFDIWNFRKSQAIIESGRYFMDQVEEDDIAVKESSESSLSSAQRQLLQVQKVKSKDLTPYVDVVGLKNEIGSWQYPLHFIDFETTTTALPFNKGRRPYEQIAFQFSHHMVHRDGTIEHKTQYIHRQRGEFPNFDFVRSLKAALQDDSGTILRYSHHENSVLCQIIRQLEVSSERDARELVAWIKSITSSSGDSETEGWQGQRSMVDLCELVKRHYYSPLTGGSNSIKKVLPAILRESTYLADRYSKPVYGSDTGIRSLNFKNWVWLQRDANGVTKDPYQLLPPIFTEAEREAIEPIVNAGEIADGGTAMMAFAMMQFTEMSDSEAKKIQDALLKYCELDTFAMVMIYEHWSNLVGLTKKNRAA